MDDKKTCKTCTRPGVGFKCADCGEESEIHDKEHECGGDRCMIMCSGCDDAEEKCECPPTAEL